MALQTQAIEDQFSSMSKQMNRWIDHVLGAKYRPYARDVWSPAVNVYEGANGYCVVVELAGVDSESIDLHYEAGQLVLTGQRETPRPCQVTPPIQTHLMEINHGRFWRTVELPAPVDGARIKARYAGGMLWVELPKVS